MKGITTMLWFDGKAEEAAKFYTSIFKNSKIKQTVKAPPGIPVPSGSVMLVAFEIDGRNFTALNGGPMFKFSEAISLVVNCDSQQEIDQYWSKLTANGGQEGQCGWLKDKFGLSWQIVPAIMDQLMSDPEKSKRVMAEVMKMKKLDMNVMKKAAGI